jgi:PAS domain S-box-containing protein
VPKTIVARTLHRDGGWRYIEAVAVNRLDEPAVGAIVANFRDVTERRRAEEALRASELRLRHIVENAQDLIYYCDPTGHFTYVNPAAERVMKFSQQELLGRHFLSLIRDDYRDQAKTVYFAQLAELTPHTYSIPAVTRTRTVWIGSFAAVYAGRVAASTRSRATYAAKAGGRGLRASEDADSSSSARSSRSTARPKRRILEQTRDGRMLGYDSVEADAAPAADIYQSPADT